MIEEIKEQVKQFISDKLSDIYSDYSSYDELKSEVTDREWDIICKLNEAENLLCF